MKINIYGPYDALRLTPKYFLRDGISADRSIALSLIETAMYDGASLVSARFDEGHSIVCFSDNWIERFYGIANYDSFKLAPLAGRQNTFRGEVLLPAFCQYYAVLENGNVSFVFGNGLDSAMVSRISLDDTGHRFCIVFKAREGLMS